MKKKGKLLKEEIKKMKQNSDFNKQIKDKINKREGKLLKEVIKDKINKREGKLLKEVIKRVKQESVFNMKRLRKNLRQY